MVKEVETKKHCRFREAFKMVQRLFRNPRDCRRRKVMQDPNFMELPVGSTHGVGTAEAVAKLHGILGNGSYDKGRSILSAEVTELLQEPLFWETDVPLDEDNKMFGHGGYGGQYAAADTKYQAGWAYVTNHLDLTSGVTQSKWFSFCDALYRCIDELRKYEVNP